MEAPNLCKTRMCPHLTNGICTKRNCTFAHHESELKKVNICNKTQLCRWFVAGKCKNGIECSFAHGENDLKSNAQNLSQQKARPAEVSVPPGLFPAQHNIEQQPNVHQSNGVQSARGTSERWDRQAAFVHPMSMPTENGQLHDPHSFQAPLQPLPFVSPLPPGPPPGFMPSFDNGYMPQQGASPVLPNMPQHGTSPVLPMPTLGLDGKWIMPPTPPMPTLGLPGNSMMVPPPLPTMTPMSLAPQVVDESQNQHLAQLMNQIHSLSGEVKRLQHAARSVAISKGQNPQDSTSVQNSASSVGSGFSNGSSEASGTPPLRNAQADNGTPPLRNEGPVEHKSASSGDVGCGRWEKVPQVVPQNLD